MPRAERGGDALQVLSHIANAERESRARRRYKFDIPECVGLFIMSVLGEKAGYLAAMACRGFRDIVAKVEKLRTIQLKLGVSYWRGTDGKPKNNAKALEYFRKSAELGSSKGMLNVGVCFTIGVNRDWAEAARWFAKCAAEGRALGEFYLAGCYERGDGVPKNVIKALELLESAAGSGLKEAQFSLAECYEHVWCGVVSKDMAKAVEWYTKVAEQGDIRAQIKVGDLYEAGDDGVVKNMEKAVAWYTRAAEQEEGDGEAAVKVANCYVEGGNGVVKSTAMAAKWYHKAAEKGHPFGQCYLGICYITGEGVVQDEVKAVSLYRKSAEQGVGIAQCYLGECYARGIGVAQDEVTAVWWYMRAADQGCTHAHDGLAALGYVYV